MKLTKSEVEHIALLARLRLNEEEKEKFTKQLSSILDYVKQLQEANTAGVEPTAHITGLINVMRSDQVEDRGKETKKQLLKSAPETDENLVKTKSVFN